jgi:glycosyltransferase involved in cell wall biosynthesis
MQMASASQTDLVSVIIPAYNVASYIAETLDSVFAQTYPHFEVIVVNDGSPDTEALEEVLRPYRDRIVYLQQENRGLAGARNTGLRAATGTLIALLDADDIWLPAYLEEQTRFLRERPDYDMVYCDAEFFGEGITPGQFYMNANPSNGEADAGSLISKQCTVFVSVMARKIALEAVGFDESLRSCEDLDCWIRFTSAGHRIGYHRSVLVLYRRHAASLSANLTRMAEFRIRVLNKSLSLFPAGAREIDLLHQAIETVSSEREIVFGKLALRAGNTQDALEHFEAANRHDPGSKIGLLVKALRYCPAIVLGLYRLRGRWSSKYSAIE